MTADSRMKVKSKKSKNRKTGEKLENANVL